MRVDSIGRYVNIRSLTREDSVLYFPPEAFGPFRVLHQIGSGALGPVFRAHEPDAGRLVAVKVFRLDLTPEKSEALVAQLNRLIALGIDSRSVSAPLAAGIDDGTAYLAMEYIVGESLDVVARGAGAMPLSDVSQIVDGIASAIEAYAACGVTHGMLHPRDVIISDDGPRVTGFGIGQALGQVGMRLPVRRPYAAPEGNSDVYSLAAIAYELISGRRMTPSGWDELSAEDGPALRDAFWAGLAEDPQWRTATATEFASQLRVAAERSQPRRPEPLVTARPLEESRFPTPDETPSVRVQPPVPLTFGVLPDESAFAETPLDELSMKRPDSDLRMEFAEAAEPELLVPSIASTPKRPRRWLLLGVMFLLAIAVAGAGAYAVRSRLSSTPGQNASAEKPAVATTTVDIPPAPAMPSVPPEPALPPPSPSRPASGAVSTPAAIAAREGGRLLIRSTPGGATVSVNGEERGKTPVTVRDLPLGSYTIHVTRDGFAGVDRRVRLTRKQPSAALEVSLQSVAPRMPAAAPTTGSSSSAASASGPGGIFVDSRPSGARVFVNDRLIGVTPMTVPDLPAGPAVVRMEMDGYQSWVTTVRVTAGEQTRVAASLETK